MTFRMDSGYPVVDAVWIDGDGYGHGVRALLLDPSARGTLREASGVGLVKAGAIALYGWGVCDGPCVRLNRAGVGYYAVPEAQWLQVEAWLDEHG